MPQQKQRTTFNQALLTLRTKLRLTQVELAKQIHVSQRAIVAWESGRSYPKTEHLKQLITLALQQQAFPDGQEEATIRTLWRTAHQKTLLDNLWLGALLAQKGSPQTTTTPVPSEEDHDSQVSVPVASQTRVDWGDALAIPAFYGRESERSMLINWILHERCRLVSVLGMGGIGKSALIVSEMHQIAKHFQVVIFRSLRDAPPCEVLLDECLQVLLPQSPSSIPTSLDQRIHHLMEQLRTKRVLLVLDNLETLLEKGDIRGHLRPDMQKYTLLLQLIVETEHQSCLLLTSREKPAILRALESSRGPVHSLLLTELDTMACKQILTEYELIGSKDEYARLIQWYTSNPLALKIVAQMIVDLFGGEITPFLAQNTVTFGLVTDLLDEQYSRLSALEQIIILWLAIMREPVTLDELRSVLATPLLPIQVLEAVDGLYRRSLIERGQRPGTITLQSVVLEYITTHLVTQASREIQQNHINLLSQYGFTLAYAKEYVHQAQERLLITPLLEHLRLEFRPQARMEEQFNFLLDQMRTWTISVQGYAPANIVTLLRALRGNLRGCNLSHLVLRGVYLQGIQMQDTTLADALIEECVFTQTFPAIAAVAINRDGRYWAAASEQGCIRVWKDAGQTLHLAWQPYTDAVWGLAFSPDGQLLATGGFHGTVKLWHVESGALLWTSKHTASTHTLAFAPNGDWLATCGGPSPLVQIWNLQCGEEMLSIPHLDPVATVAWSPDGQHLASGDFEGQLLIWQIQKTQATLHMQMQEKHSNWIQALTFAPDGSMLASASGDGTVKLWELNSGHLLQTLTGHGKGQIHTVTWSPDGRTLASGGSDQTIMLWDVEQHNYRATLHGHTEEVMSLAFTPDGHYLLSGSGDGSLRLWDVESGRCVRVIQGYSCPLSDIDWSPDGTHLACGGWDSLITIWSVPNQILPPRVLEHHAPVSGVGWSPDGRWLASCGWDRIIKLWNTTTGNFVELIWDQGDPETYFLAIAWNPNGQQLACVTLIHGVLIWDVKTQHFHRIGHHLLTFIIGVAWHPNGTQIAGIGEDRSIYVWDSCNGELLQQLHGPQAMMTSIIWSPNGTRLVSCGSGNEGGQLIIWDMQKGEHVRTLTEKMGMVTAIAWGPSEDLLVSGNSNGELHWWNVQYGECIRQRQAHRGTVRALKVNPDDQTLASCGDDGTIMLWNLHHGKYQHTLRRDRPYERLDITGIRGLTEAQKAALRTLGAIERLGSLPLQC